MSGPTIVARLAMPMPVNGGLTRVVKGLEDLYGKGLVVLFDQPDTDKWMVIARPADAA